MKTIKLFATLLLITIFFTTTSYAEVFYYDTDNVGSPVALWDSSGKKVWEIEYYPFGEEYTKRIVPERNDKRFIGKEKDNETGLTYFGARYYDEKSGRFLQPDPVKPVDEFTSNTYYALLEEPQRLNRYAYGLNNPYRYVDPDGNSPWDVVDVGFFALSVKNFASNPGWGTGAELAADTVSLLPLVPSIGWITKADDAVDLLKASNNANKVKLNKQLASQQQMSDLNSGLGKTIAGAGSDKALRDAPRLANQHGGAAADWSKVKSSSKTFSDGTTHRTHAYRNSSIGKTVEHKTKLKD